MSCILHDEEYLGDGLYARFDGYHVILRAPRSDGDHYVALEPPVLRAFDDYRERLHHAIIEYKKIQVAKQQEQTS